MKSSRNKWLICFLLIGSVAAIYWPVVRHDFIDFDDPQFTTDNPDIRAGLSGHSLRYAFVTPVVANWHPLTTLSHILDCQLFGLNAGAHHLVSAAIHAVNAALLFLALSSMTGSWRRSAMAAAIFALHPLRVESVSWIAERKDVLSGFFFLLMLGAYARYARTVHGRGLRAEKGGEGQSETERRIERRSKAFWYFAALVLFAFGLMSKPMLVTTPFVLLLLDYWPLERLGFGNRSEGRNMLRPETSSSAKASSSANASEDGSEDRMEGRRSPLRLLVEKIPFLALSAASCWITLMFQKGATIANSGIPLGARIENAVVSYARYVGKFFWPTKLSIVYPHPATAYGAASRWEDWQIWLAALGLIAVSATALAMVRRRPYFAAGWFWYLGTMVPVIGVIQVGEQAMADRYTYIPLIGPLVALVWFSADVSQGLRFGKAFRVAIASAAVLACAILTAHQLGYWKNTATLFAHAVEVTKDNAPAEFSLGVGLEKQGRTEEAMVHYRKALELNPLDEQAHYNLGLLLRKRGDWAEAAEHFGVARQINPNNFAALLNLGDALIHLRRTKEAIGLFEQALTIDPNSIEALNNLAWVLATSGEASLRNGSRAVQLAQRACQLTDFKETALAGTLAAAYAEAGRFQEAAATAEKACALASKANQSELLEKNRQLLELYRQGKAYHEPDQK